MSLTDYITGVQHIGIPAKDLDETIAFYEKLGFEKAGYFPNGDNHCAFMRLGNLTIETYDGEISETREEGSISHISINTTDIEKAFDEAHKLGLNVIDSEIQSIPSFWDNGIRFFNILGPNNEKLEFCQIL